MPPVEKCEHCGNEHAGYKHVPAQTPTCVDCAEGVESYQQMLEMMKAEIPKSNSKRAAGTKRACEVIERRCMLRASNCGNPRCPNVIRVRLDAT